MATSRIPRLILIALLLLLSLCLIVVFVASAAGPDPRSAPFIDNRVHTLAGNSDTWFKFAYNDADVRPRPTVSLTLVNGTRSGVRFEVWSFENIDEWTLNKPVGRGTAASMNCDTGQVIGSGECKVNDLTWVGSFALVGTYYVRVVNENSSPASYQLIIQGEGIRLGPPQQAGPGIPTPPTPLRPARTITPVAFALTVPAVDDPNRAALIDNQPHSIPANSATWYKFDYSGGGPNPKPVFFLRLVNGILTGVRFEVWAPENLNHWWENKPVGRGTQEVLTNCFATAAEPTATGEPTPTPEPTATPTGKCPTNDLTWAGAFGAPGTYFVRVVNETPFAQPFQLILEGQGATIGAPTFLVPGAVPGAPTPPTPLLPAQTRTPIALGPLALAIDDPNRATFVDNQPHALPPHAATWYKFDYPGGDPKPVFHLRLVNGILTGVRFEVWAPENLNNWWLGTPVGRGTQEVLTNCFVTEAEAQPTAEPGQPTPTPLPTATPTGKCLTNDLTWAGAFGGAGIYFVRVVNESDAPQSYTLKLTP